MINYQAEMGSKGKVTRLVRSSELATPPKSLTCSKTAMFLQLISQLGPLGSANGVLGHSKTSDDLPPCQSVELKSAISTPVVELLRDVAWEPIAADKLRVAAARLPNGMQVAIVESDEHDEAILGINIQAGTAMDPVDRPGLTELTTECVVSAIKQLLGMPRVSKEVPSVSLCCDAVVNELTTAIHLKVKPDGLANASEQFAKVVRNPDQFITGDIVTAALHDFHRLWNFTINNLCLATDRLINHAHKRVSPGGFRGSSALLKRKNVEELRQLVVDTVTKRFGPANTRTVMVGGPGSTDALKLATAPLVSVPARYVDESTPALTDVESAVQHRGTLTRVMPRELVEKVLSFRFPMGVNQFSQKDWGFAWFVARLFTASECGSLAADLKQRGLADHLSCRVSDSGGCPELVVDMHLDCGTVSDDLVHEIGRLLYTHIGSLRETRNFEALLRDHAEYDLQHRRVARLATSWNKDSSFQEVLEADGVKNDEAAVVEVARMLERIGNAENVRVMVIDSDYMPGTPEALDDVEELPAFDADVLRQKLPDAWKTSWVPVTVSAGDVKWKAPLLRKKQHMESYAVNFMRLKNDLTLVLVSAPGASKFSVCSCTRAGGTSDPADYPGLAHLVEHILYDGGSKNFPGGMDRTVESGVWGGATTSPHNTTYKIEAQVDHADKLLACMADMLTNPLLSRQCLETELAAVNAEWDLRSKSTFYRNNDITHLLGNPDHVMHQVLGGNESVLLNLDKFGGDREKALEALRDAAEAFYRTHYSANTTSVVVLAPNPISELEKMTVSRFSQMPNLNRVPLEGSERWTDDNAFYRQGRELNQLITVPAESPPHNILRYSWLVNDQFSKWDSNPLDLVSSVLSQTQKGSLSAILRERQLAAQRILCHRTNGGFGPQFFDIYILFDDEVKITNEIVAEIGEIICGQLRLLKDSGVPQWMVDEARDLSLNDWFFAPTARELEMTTESVENIGWMPVDQIFSENHTPQKGQEVAEEMERFADNKNLLILRNEKVSDEDLPTFEFDPRSTFHFKREPIPQTILQRCASVWNMSREEFSRFAQDQGFQLPSPNRFISSDLRVKTGGERGDLIAPGGSAPKLVPNIALGNHRMNVWHKQVTFANSPKVDLVVRMRVPTLEADVDSLRLLSSQDFQTFFDNEKAKLAANCDFADLAPVTKHLYVTAFCDAHQESIMADIQQAKEAGLDAYFYDNLFGSHRTIELRVKGFDAKAGEALDTLLESWTSPKLEDHHISGAITIQKLIMGRRVQHSDPVGKAADLCKESLFPGSFSREQMKTMADLLDASSLRRFFSPEGVKAMFEGTMADAVVVGNVTEDEVRDFFTSDKRSPVWKHLIQASGDLTQDRIVGVDLRELQQVLFNKEELASSNKMKGLLMRMEDPNPDENNCGVLVAFVRDSAPEHTVLFNILRGALHQKFYDDLRVNQKLGYYVVCLSHRTGPRRYLTFALQSDRDSSTVLTRVLEFVQKNLYDGEKGELTLQLGEEKFQELKKSTRDNLTRKYRSVTALSEFYQREIRDKSLDFSRVRRQLAYLDALTLDEFKSQVKHLVTDVPFVASCVYPKSENTQVATPTPNVVNWYEVKDNRDLTTKHFDGALKVLQFPFLG